MPGLPVEMLLRNIVYQLRLLESPDDLHPLSRIFQGLFLLVLIRYLQVRYPETVVVIERWSAIQSRCTILICIRSKIETALPT